MPDIAGSILSQMEMAGQPREFTTTTEAWSEEPLDLGSLGIILALLLGGEDGLFGGKKPEGEFPGAGFTPPGPGLQFTEPTQMPFPSISPMPSGLPPTALTPTQGAGLSPWDLLELLTQGAQQPQQPPQIPNIFSGG